MTRSRFARRLAGAAVLATALLVPSGALATGLYPLNGQTTRGIVVSTAVESGNLKVHTFNVHVLLRCTNHHNLATEVAGSGFHFSHYDSVHNSLDDHYVSYHAHSTSGGIRLALAVQIVHRHNGVVTASGTFNAATSSHGVPCDTGGNIRF